MGLLIANWEWKKTGFFPLKGKRWSVCVEERK